MNSDDLSSKPKLSRRTVALLLIFGAAALVVIASNALQSSPESPHCGQMKPVPATDCCAKMKSATETSCAHHAADAASTPATTNATAIPTQLVPLFEQYTAIQKALAADSIQGVSDSATAIAKLMKASGSGYLAQTAPVAEKVAQANGLTDARSEFKTLSLALIRYLGVTGALGGEYHEAYCAMAKASWLQKGATLENPYMGKAMLHCGQFKS